MGGKGSGGRRRGAGRPRKSDAERFITGNAGKRGARVLEHPSATVPPATPLPVVDESEAPDELNVDERNVWVRLAPHALQNGTLTPATQLAFALLCKNIVRERRYGESVTECGSSNHRGLIARVEAGLDAFQLRPTGKGSMAPVQEKPVSKLSRFMSRG